MRYFSAAAGDALKNFAVIYLADITEVPDFNTMYELYDPSTVMFFFWNKHMMIDLGTGNNNKINWAMKDKQEFVDIVETVQWSSEGPWSGDYSQGLLHQLPLLKPSMSACSCCAIVLAYSKNVLA
jgi:DIM1 family U5 snRNP protein